MIERINLIAYASIGMASTICYIAVIIGWEPSARIVAMIAFGALSFACGARYLIIRHDQKCHDHPSR